MAASRQAAPAAAICVLLATAVGGCGNVTPQVPQGAELRMERPDVRGVLALVATENGTAYLVDRETGKVVLSGQMEMRDQLVVHLARNMVFLNGTLIRQGGLDPKRAYQLYFLKS